MGVLPSSHSDNMQFLLLSLSLSLPLSSGLSGSHVSVTMGGSSYSHGDIMDFNHAAPTFPAASTSAVSSSTASVPGASAPTSSTASVPGSLAPIPSTPSTTDYYSPFSASYAPFPASYPPAPVRYLPDPVVVSKPTHQIQHRPAYDQHAPAPVYPSPRQNCSVVSEMKTVEVCTPSLQTTCTMVKLSVKTIKDQEQCMNITRTICSVNTEEIEEEMCVHTYQSKAEDTTATTYEVSFTQECQTQAVTVCQPSAGSGYYSYGQQDCKEEEQKTCYKVPTVMPREETVTVSYPEPVEKCMQKTITIPRVTCEDVTEKRCVMFPEIMDDMEMVEKCEVILGPPFCQVMEVALPKQVCKELVYGQRHVMGEDSHIS